MRVRYSFSSRRTGNIDNIRKQKKPFPKVVLEVVNISDVILEILDARFIKETRNPALEKLITGMNKKIIYVLNKADLVDIKEKKKELEEQKIFPYVFISCKNRKGAFELKKKIKIEASRLKIPEESKAEMDVEELRKLNFKRKQVGVVGYPNTGKSSVINFLTGRHGAGVGAEAGFTKGMQKIKLSKDVLILDTPGVIPEKEYSSTSREKIAHHAKLSVRTYNKVKDPEFIVTTLMEKYGEALDKFYNVVSNNDPEQLIENVGKKKNLLIKGGLVDIDRAARFILKDWQEGNIRL